MLVLSDMFLFSLGLVFPVLTLFLMPEIMEDRFRSLAKCLVAALIVVAALNGLIMCVSYFTVYGTLVSSFFEGMFKIAVYAGFILFFIQLFLYLWWYTAGEQKTVFQCWLWLEYLALLVVFWYVLTPILYFTGFGIDRLEIVLGIPVLLTVIYTVFREWPDSFGGGMVGKIFGNKYVRIFAFLFGILNSATVWYYIIIGEAPRTFFSICLASAIGALGWQTGGHR